MKMHSPCIVLAATALVAGQGGREEIEKVNNGMVMVTVGVMGVGLMAMVVVVIVRNGGYDCDGDQDKI